MRSAGNWSVNRIAFAGLGSFQEFQAYALKEFQLEMTYNREREQINSLILEKLGGSTVEPKPNLRIFGRKAPL